MLKDIKDILLALSHSPSVHLARHLSTITCQSSQTAKRNQSIKSENPFRLRNTSPLGRKMSKFLKRSEFVCKICQFRRISDSASSAWGVVSNGEVKRFIEDCMTSVGTRRDHAESLADNLVTADYRGHYSHGLNRLGMHSFGFLIGQ